MTLDELKDALLQGQIPPTDGLGASALEELQTRELGHPGPRYWLCGVAAALLDDVDLWRRNVGAHQSRDGYYRRQLKWSGLDADDLGPRASYPRSLDIVRRGVSEFVDTLPPATRSAVRQAVERIAAMDASR